MMYLTVPSAEEYGEPPDEQEALFRQKVQILWKEECLVDVTLACEGKLLTAHKLVLSAYSDYFKDMFTSIRNASQYPIVFMKDVPGDILEAILEFMYCGEVNVTQHRLSAFIKTARTLKIKGLSFLEDNCSEQLEESIGKRRQNSKADMQWTTPAKRRRSQSYYNQNDFEDGVDLDSVPHSFGSTESRLYTSGSFSQDNVSHHKRINTVDRGHHPVKKSLSHCKTEDAMDASFTSHSDDDDDEMHPTEELSHPIENHLASGENYKTRDLRKSSQMDDNGIAVSKGSRWPNTANKRSSTELNKLKMETHKDFSSGDDDDIADKLVRFIEYMSKITPPTENQVRCFAWGIDSVLGSEYFGSQGPSKQWWSLFKKKHPNIKKVLRVVDFLKSSHMKPVSLSFRALAEYLVPLQEIITAFDLGDKPDHIWSCCEYSMNLNSLSEARLVPSRERFMKHSSFKSTDDCVSLMLAGSAVGKVMSPFTVFKGSLPPEEFKKEGLSTAMYDKNDSGFMDADLILKWFEHTFLPQCPPNRSEDSPIVLLLNSSFPLVPAKMLDLALAENVILLSLMPHVHHACQPLDNVFVKGLHKRFLEALRQKNVSNKEALCNYYPKLIKEAFDKGNKPDIVAEGFRICGIFPLSDGVDQKEYLDIRILLNFDKLLPSMLDADVDKLISKQDREIRRLQNQNNEASTSDEEEEFGDSSACYICGNARPTNGDGKWLKCLRRACKNVSCEECLPSNYDESTGYTCIDCSHK